MGSAGEYAVSPDVGGALPIGRLPGVGGDDMSYTAVEFAGPTSSTVIGGHIGRQVPDRMHGVGSGVVLAWVVRRW